MFFAAKFIWKKIQLIRIDVSKNHRRQSEHVGVIDRSEQFAAKFLLLFCFLLFEDTSRGFLAWEQMLRRGKV